MKELSLEDIQQVLRQMDTSGCNHSEAVTHISAYGWTCKCGRNDFLKATPELREEFKRWTKNTPKSTKPPKEIFGIKVYEA